MQDVSTFMSRWHHLTGKKHKWLLYKDYLMIKKKKSEKRTPLHLPYKWHLCELKESTLKWSHHCATCSLTALQSRSQFTLKPQQDGNYFYHPLLTMKEWFISGEATQPRNIWSKTSLDGCNLSLGNCCSLRAINVMLSEISLSENLKI